MTIRLDDRVGSVELGPLFKPYGISPNVCRLDFGDADFFGNGPQGQCAIAVERKRINDLISSIQSKRLSGHQMPGMAKGYDYAYLIVEGIWRPAANDQIEILGKIKDQWVWQSPYSGQVTYRQIDNYLSTKEIMNGVIFRRTASSNETVAVIVDLLRWWTKGWDDHHSHDIKYQPASDGHRLRMTAPSQVELVARTLPGMDREAYRVSKFFPTVKSMILATEKEWTAVDGVGAVTARKIMEVLHGSDC